MWEGGQVLTGNTNTAGPCWTWEEAHVVSTAVSMSSKRAYPLPPFSQSFPVEWHSCVWSLVLAPSRGGGFDGVNSIGTHSVYIWQLGRWIAIRFTNSNWAASLSSSVRILLLFKMKLTSNPTEFTWLLAHHSVMEIVGVLLTFRLGNTSPVQYYTHPLVSIPYHFSVCRPRC